MHSNHIWWPTLSTLYLTKEILVTMYIYFDWYLSSLSSFLLALQIGVFLRGTCSFGRKWSSTLLLCTFIILLLIFSFFLCLSCVQIPWSFSLFFPLPLFLSLLSLHSPSLYPSLSIPLLSLTLSLSLHIYALIAQYYRPPFNGHLFVRLLLSLCLNIYFLSTLPCHSSISLSLTLYLSHSLSLPRVCRSKMNNKLD